MTEPEGTAATAAPADEAAAPDDRSRILHNSYRTNRLEAFSDGVFAIAITLLVLEIGVPDGIEDDLAGAVLAQLPSLLAYVVSFATIGALWLAHTVLTEYVERVDAVFIRLNLLLLLVVAFIPFPTRLLAEHMNSTDAERFATTFYGLTLLTATILSTVMWRYAARARLLREDIDDEQVRILSARMLPGLGFYVVMLIVGLVRPLGAVIGYLVIAVFFLLPTPIRDPRPRRRRNRA